MEKKTNKRAIEINMGDEFNKVEIFDKDNKLIDRDIVN
jgi:hypothetical protein